MAEELKVAGGEGGGFFFFFLFLGEEFGGPNCFSSAVSQSHGLFFQTAQKPDSGASCIQGELDYG